MLSFQPEFEVLAARFPGGFPFLVCPVADFLLGHGLGPGRGRQGPHECVFFFHDWTLFIFLRVHHGCGVATFERKLLTRAPFYSHSRNYSLQRAARRQKKADVIEQPELFDHVGLLVNWLPGPPGAPFI